MLYVSTKVHILKVIKDDGTFLRRDIGGNLEIIEGMPSRDCTHLHCVDGTSCSDLSFYTHIPPPRFVFFLFHHTSAFLIYSVKSYRLGVVVELALSHSKFISDTVS